MDDIIVTIRAIISEKGLKQNYVAEKAGFTPQELNNILCGRKVFKTEYVKPICNALDIMPNELFGITS